MNIGCTRLWTAGFGPKEKITVISKLNNEVIRMIASSISTIRTNQGTKRIREDQANYFTDDQTQYD